MNHFQKIGLAITAFLCLILTSCNTDSPTPQAPQPDPGEVFRTVYRFPIAEPRKGIGEAEILNATAIQRENSKVTSVLSRILADVQAKKLIPTPIDPEYVPNYDENYAVEAIASVSQSPGYSSEALVQGFEVDYKGIVRGGETTWETNYLRIVYIDPSNVLPDRNMFQLTPEQIAEYRLGDKNEGQDLTGYLNEKMLEGYPILVESPVDTFRFQTYEQAVHYGALMEAGDIDQLTRNPS